MGRCHTFLLDSSFFIHAAAAATNRGEYPLWHFLSCAFRIAKTVIGTPVVVVHTIT